MQLRDGTIVVLFTISVLLKTCEGTAPVFPSPSLGETFQQFDDTLDSNSSCGLFKESDPDWARCIKSNSSAFVRVKCAQRIQCIAGEIKLAGGTHENPRCLSFNVRIDKSTTCIMIRNLILLLLILHCTQFSRSAFHWGKPVACCSPACLSVALDMLWWGACPKSRLHLPLNRGTVVSPADYELGDQKDDTQRKKQPSQSDARVHAG